MADSSQTLRATYNSPTNPTFSHTAAIPFSTSNTTSERTSYLSALRSETGKLQGLINAELTTRMENDKAQQASDLATSARKGVVDEVAEEENYGEEVMEED
ncbi:hypothetical protein V496_01182 [Pseudogymnoascus sp. VKM F-4515 (FW-2607)]|nr:hypothetical protein V496_01182 [Pseudogymnoascus sp. VKM F-4515 (FW-2607)]KFY87232.1 hypothetical protein V498_07243 [Pseudogymnoascus sp. VKM F-4517 (FW-2822)]